jgi:branched-chain amino acid transport system ATP-binding protein
MTFRKGEWCLLELKNASVSYGKVKALRDVDMHVGEGEFVALIGSNGAGKSTTLKAICGIEPLESGSISFAGQVISRLPYYKIKEAKITLIPEGRQLFPYMTVKENLEMGFYGEKQRTLLKERLEKVYTYFPDVYTKRNELASSLSGGQQQMVAIGRGLMSDPKLILLDEPSLGLSPLLVQNVAKIIHQLHEEGLSILLVEQNARLALSLAQRGYVLESGRIVLADEAKALLKNTEVQKAYLGI